MAFLGLVNIDSDYQEREFFEAKDGWARAQISSPLQLHVAKQFSGRQARISLARNTDCKSGLRTGTRFSSESNQTATSYTGILAFTYFSSLNFFFFFF